MAKYKIFVDGSSGTTGLRIADRLAARPEFEILTIPEGDRKDVRARAARINESDLSFLCLPDAAAREVAPLLRPGVRVPGCHATGFIAPVAPLVAAGLLPRSAHLCCYSLTGYSGGGKTMIAAYQAPRQDPALSAPRPYGLALHHKHLPEMRAVTGLETAPNFVPIVADYYAGMVTMVPLDLEALGLTARQVADTLAAAYAGGPVVAVHPLNEGADGGFLASNALAGSDRLEIFCLADPEGRQMQLISLFDNLGKGSSGAAVQCMNLMLGLDECAGLAL